MNEDAAIFLGRGKAAQALALRFANRHGLISGAPGTGKTVSLQVLAEGFSAQGIPVFLTDVKGDLSGICQAGSPTAGIEKRVRAVGLDGYRQRAFPVGFWDVFGEDGHPIRTTISEMGPVLLARVLGLNETQQGVLAVAFQVADDLGLLLLDLKDLRALMNLVGEKAPELSSEYGRVSTASVGAIQRRLLTLEHQGGGHFFGEPAFDIGDLMRTDETGSGIVDVLAADRLIMMPKLYATLLLWLLSELFEKLPEAGDGERPRLVFLFEEAHLLFVDAPKLLLQKVEQLMRLISSKGVGVYFVTRHPLDVPDAVLGQLGNRIQHALPAITSRDQREVRAAAETFRGNAGLDVTRAITELAVGEALVSTFREEGVPSPVERALIRPPASRIGPATAAERARAVAAGPLRGRYDKSIGRDAAYEILKQRAEHELSRSEAARQQGGRRAAAPRAARRRHSVVEEMGGSIGRRISHRISRGILGSILKR